MHSLYFHIRVFSCIGYTTFKYQKCVYTEKKTGKFTHVSILWIEARFIEIV
jgi:hypothetical protein